MESKSVYEVNWKRVFWIIENAHIHTYAGDRRGTKTRGNRIAHLQWLKLWITRQPRKWQKYGQNKSYSMFTWKFIFRYHMSPFVDFNAAWANEQKKTKKKKSSRHRCRKSKRACKRVNINVHFVRLVCR